MKQTRRILITLLLGVVIAFAGKTTSEAATITQTTQTQDSITINFDSGLTGSSVLTVWKATLQVKDDNYNDVLVQESAALTPDVKDYTFIGLAPGTEYRVRVDYTYKGSSGKEYSTDKSTAICTAPGKVTGLNQTTWWYYVKSVDFAWDKQSACKYEWVAYQGKKQVANGSESSTNKGSFSIKNNKLYTVQVRAYETINGQVLYGDWSDTAYLFTQPMISNKKGVVIDGSGKMKVKWEKIDGVTGYEVYVSTKELTGYKKVASVKAKKGSATIKKLGKKKFSKKKTYYVYIMAKKKVDGVTYTSGRHYTMQYKKGSNTLRWSFNNN